MTYVVEGVQADHISAEVVASVLVPQSGDQLTDQSSTLRLEQATLRVGGIDVDLKKKKKKKKKRISISQPQRPGVRPSVAGRAKPTKRSSLISALSKVQVTRSW